MDNAFEYVKKYGIEGEKEYPYKAQDLKCNWDKVFLLAFGMFHIHS